MSTKKKISFDGTLHIGSLCNENYRLFRALRLKGINAHYVHFERIAEKHYTSDPRAVDSNFNITDPFIHNVSIKTEINGLQKLYELYCIWQIIRSTKGKFWVHSQTEFPIYVSLFTRNYSAHSSGSDLRKNYFLRGIKNRLLAWSYNRARVVFYHNIDLHDHIISQTHKSYNFIPNICDLRSFQSVENENEYNESVFRIFMPSRITFYDTEDIKGNGIFLESLSYLKDCQIQLTLPQEDIQVNRWASEIEKRFANVQCQFIKSRTDKLTYYNAINNSDIIIDQFYLGAMGMVALECFSMKRVALVSLDSKAFRECYKEEFTLPEIKSPKILAKTIRKLMNRPCRKSLENQLLNFIERYHTPNRVANIFLKTLEREGKSMRGYFES